MTRKHFIALAEALRASRPEPDDYLHTDEYQARLSTWEYTVRAVAGTCRSFNGLFDLYRFLAAAGVES